MTSFDVFCFTTTLAIREAELEAAERKRVRDTANVTITSGDAGKGAKLFQVSIDC